jgi:addiction module HigA family antidote
MLKCQVIFCIFAYDSVFKVYKTSILNETLHKDGAMRKRVPTHPGALLRADVLPSLPGMSVSAFARKLGVSRQTLHAVLAERRGVSAEMALRLGTLLGNGAQLWLDMQT